jgi:hypothetical protein
VARRSIDRHRDPKNQDQIFLAEFIA